MGADSLQQALAAVSYLGSELDHHQQGQLLSFHRWLREEAIPAGGVGPREGDRLWNRHIGDSLLFGIGLSGASTCLDIGSGAGLPGIPLAIAFPRTEHVLLDRSGRRCDLLRRAIAILRLENCVVRHAEVGQVADQFQSIVSRAAMPPDRILIHVKRLLAPGGVAIVGLSRSDDGGAAIARDDKAALAVKKISINILDSAFHLLRIEATQS